MLTSKQVRERLSIGRDKLRELIQTGQLEAIRTGDTRNAHYRFTEEALAAYIERRTVTPARAS